LTYFSLPFYRAMLERSGYGEDIAAFDAAPGDGAAICAAISDGFLDALTAAGDESAVQAGGVMLPSVRFQRPTSSRRCARQRHDLASPRRYMSSLRTRAKGPQPASCSPDFG
jgi:hypothetical protein